MAAKKTKSRRTSGSKRSTKRSGGAKRGKAGRAAAKKTRGGKPAKKATRSAKKSTSVARRRGKSPLQRVRSVAKQVAQQAQTAMSGGVDALREMGENIAERVGG